MGDSSSDAGRPSEDPSGIDGTSGHDTEDLQPKGAIMVTAITALTILVMFFGVLGILMARS